MPIRVGLKSALFPGQTEHRVEQAVELVTSGYENIRAIEPRLFADRDLGENFDKTKEKIKEVAKRAHDNDISIGLELNDGWREEGEPFPMDPISPHEKIRETSLRYIQRAEELAVDSRYCEWLLIPFMGHIQMIPVGKKPEFIDYERAIQKYREFLNRHRVVNRLETVPYSANIFDLSIGLFSYTPIYNLRHIMLAISDTPSVKVTVDVAHDAQDQHFNYSVNRGMINGRLPATIRTSFGDIYTMMFEEDRLNLGEIKKLSLPNVITRAIINSIIKYSNRISDYHISNAVAVDAAGTPTTPEEGYLSVKAGVRWDNQYGLLRIPELLAAIKQHTPDALAIAEPTEPSGNYLEFPEGINLVKYLAENLR